MRSGRVIAISSAQAFARPKKSLAWASLNALAIALNNDGKSGALITGVRSVPKYRFRVITVTVVPSSACARETPSVPAHTSAIVRVSSRRIIAFISLLPPLEESVP